MLRPVPALTYADLERNDVIVDPEHGPLIFETSHHAGVGKNLRLYSFRMLGRKTLMRYELPTNPVRGYRK